MHFVWKDRFNKYIQLQRNHKTFSERMLEKLIKQQQKEIERINFYLGKKPQKVLDIGCGLGIYDLALYDFYKEDIKFYLLDKTSSEEEEKNTFYGHRDKGSFYNNLDYTKEFLQLNGINENNIELINVEDDIDTTNEYLQKNLSDIDLIISIISWGFHYPIKTYLDTVYNIISDNGILCLHCRNLKENLPLLKSKFNILSPINEKIRDGSFLICKKINVLKNISTEKN